MSELYDLLIVGGGIHGAGIARDAAGRGLRVALCEQGDFAGATSSASSKLIHGGLRYLEYGKFRLVREALQEREILLRIAPHISRPMRFVLPHVAELRPAWMIRLGLLFYDRLSTHTALPSSGALDLRASSYGAPLVPGLRKAFSYFDGWADDARLVILNLRSAVQHGARVLPRTRLIGATPVQQGWRALLAPSRAAAFELHARVLINAAGPWVDTVRGLLSLGFEPRTRLVRGSHIVVPALYVGEHAYLLQNVDRRAVFLLPFGASHTLIGTTDVPVTAALAHPQPEASEVEYLCAATSRFLRRPIAPDDVVHSFSGVRALLDDGHIDPSAVTRDYALLLEHVQDAAVLSILGGKLTTYRSLAEKALGKLHRYLPSMDTKSWTGKESLPGGDLPDGGMPVLQTTLAARYPRLPGTLLSAYAHRYGTLAPQLLGDATSEEDLGVDFGGGLYAREVDYLIEHEWVQSAEDVLWRRTKTGLTTQSTATGIVQEYLHSRLGAKHASGSAL